MQKMNNKTGFEQIEKIIESRLEMQTRDAGIILDISMLPFFEKIITAKRKEKITIFVPDTIKKLISKGEKNRQYYFYLTRLIDRWTEREVDINFLKKLY